MSRRQKAFFVVNALLWSPIMGLLGVGMVYEPIKFSYVIHRVESAKTPAEERTAFELAKRSGCCWEIHLESPPRTFLPRSGLSAVVRDPEQTLAVELEWLESKWGGIPYRAYRTLNDKANIYVLVGR